MFSFAIPSRDQIFTVCSQYQSNNRLPHYTLSQKVTTSYVPSTVKLVGLPHHRQFHLTEPKSPTQVSVSLSNDHPTLVTDFHNCAQENWLMVFGNKTISPLKGK